MFLNFYLAKAGNQDNISGVQGRSSVAWTRQYIVRSIYFEANRIG